MENGPLEVGHESNSSCTVRGAKGDFIRFSYLYPCIFESRIHTFSKAHALSYAHNEFGNGHMHILGEMTSKKWTLNGFVRGRPKS